MNMLGWMHRKFKQNNDEQSRNVSTRKCYSCSSVLRELDEHQYYHGAKNNSAYFRKPRGSSESSVAIEAHSMEEVNEEGTADMSHEFFHGFLAIGTLSSVSTTKEPMEPKVAMPSESGTEEETGTAENELQSPNKKLEKLVEKKVQDASNGSSKGRVVTLNEKEFKGMDTIENKSIVVYPGKDYSDLQATKEETWEQMITPHNPFKKNATSNKRSGKLNKLEKRETHTLHVMKKMLNKLDLTSRCIPNSASGNAVFCDSTKKKLTKVLQKSRKIHPEADGLDATKSHGGMSKKESVSSSMFANRPLNNQTAGRKAHWIKTDADYLVLEF